MRKTLSSVLVLCLSAGILCAGGYQPAQKDAAPQFKKYSMDRGYFSCGVPAGWALQREQERDEEYKIFEIQLLAPGGEKVPVSAFVSYYSKDNEDFDGYEDYIERNSRNALGETRSATENYEPVKKITLGGRKGFELSNEVLEYLHPETKSDESVRLKEKIYVLPAKAGFYVIRFNAPNDAFLKNLPVFEKIAKSFKGKF